MPDRWHTTNRETGRFAHEVGCGAFDRLSKQRGNLRLVHTY